MATSSDVQMDPKPPNDVQKEQKERASFKDTLVGNKNARNVRERVDLIDSSHREWLVVSRTKKSSKANGKGISQVKGSGLAGAHGKVTHKIPPQNNASGKKNPQGDKVSDHSVLKNQASSAAGQNNARKNNINAAVKNLNTKDPPHGIKTMLNVDIIAGNRLRFRDEDGIESISPTDNIKETQPQPHDTTNNMDADMDIKSASVQQESHIQSS
ncbi:hypothetical protein SESBI_01595 [Sesbania bispinosa]|nr:hypothetical protein SESBI_01595 [Sesbania bispinosa]